MAKLIHSALMSLDGYIEDEQGSFDWAFPSDEVHQFVNDFLRPFGTHLYGRRMYEVMRFWEDSSHFAGQPVSLDFARIWQSADKIVYSTTLESAPTARTRIERVFDPAAIRELKARADRDITVGGAELAAEALRFGLVDEVRLILAPIAVGGGKRALPADVRIPLELLDECRFENGMVHLHYRVTN
jgi:dihydrofolate reductase